MQGFHGLEEKLKGRSVAIIGDLVADQFLNGTIARVSREAPVFILRHEETETRPGGAANTAANISAMGGKPLLVGLIGDDRNGHDLEIALHRAGVATDRLLHAAGSQTTTKVRVLAGQHYAARQQVIRIDYEGSESTAADHASELMDRAREAIRDAETVVMSDYGYGSATPEIYSFVSRAAAAEGKPLIVDSRFRLGRLCGATAGTPNKEEAEAILGEPVSIAGVERLRGMLQFKALIVTCGNEGIVIAEEGQSPIQFEAVGPLEPVDVTGAGDTVIAAFALAVASGLPYLDAAMAANHAGGIVVMKKGTATVTAPELAASLAAGPAAAQGYAS